MQRMWMLLPRNRKQTSTSLGFVLSSMCKKSKLISPITPYYLLAWICLVINSTYNQNEKVIKKMTRSDDHRTPVDLFDQLDKMYGPYHIDVAASSENAKCHVYVTKEQNALEQNWNLLFNHSSINVWCNPPYHSIDDWVNHAIKQVSLCGSITMLLPNRTDRPWFRTLMTHARNIHFIQGRLRFTGPHEIKNSCSPQGSIVFYLDDLYCRARGEQEISFMTTMGMII